MHQLPGISLLGIPGKLFASCLEKRCLGKNEHNAKILSTGFVRSYGHISLSNKSLKNLGNMQRCLRLFCRSLNAFTLGCFAEVSCLATNQLPVSVHTIGVCRWCCLRQGVVSSPLLFMVSMDLIGSHSWVNELVIFGSCKINHVLLQTSWCCLHHHRTFSTRLIGFPLRVTKR